MSNTGSSQKEMYTEDDFMPDTQLPDYFNEIDPQETNEYKLRTLADFEVTDARGNVVDFEEIPKRPDKAEFTVRGYCIEPMSFQSRQTLLNLVCSASSDVPPTSAAGKAKKDKNNTSSHSKDTNSADANSADANSADANSTGAKELGDQEDKLTPPAELDRASLKKNDLIDGYCNRTFQWFRAKVVEVSGELGTDDEELKIHFQGWNSMYDEWIPRGSSRLAALNTAEKMEIYESKAAADLVPWYETKELYKKMQEKCGTGDQEPHPYPEGRLSKELRKEKVVISGVTDWCIDLSYCAPTLWLITSKDIWYRVAGLFSPCGHHGFPSPRYSAAFDPFVLKFEVTAHVSYVLADFYAQNPKISVQDVVAEVVARTHGSISEGAVLHSHGLICSQIPDLPLHEDWNKKLKPYSASVFIYQMSRYGPASENALEWQPKKPVRTKLPVKSVGYQDKLAHMMTGRNHRQLSIFQHCITKSAGIKAVVPDGDLWDTDFYRGILPKPIPEPTSSPQLQMSNEQIFHVLQTWSMCMNYRGPLDFPYLSLNRFIQQFHLSDSEPLPMSNVFREVHCRLLAYILVDSNFSQGSTALGFFEFLQIVNTEAVSSYEDARNGIIQTGPYYMLHQPNKCVEEVNVHDTEQIMILLRGGDTWLEVLRMFIALRERVHLKEYDDHIAGCLEALLDLMTNEKAAEAFLRPIKPEEDGVADYHERIKSPMDLTTIRTRISQGYYDSLVASAVSQDNVDSADYDPESTQFKGVRGILKDVQTVWTNCYSYWEPIALPTGETEHVLVGLAKKCEEAFRKAFASKVLGVPKEEELEIADLEEELETLYIRAQEKKKSQGVKTSPVNSGLAGTRFSDNEPPVFGLSVVRRGDLFKKDTETPWATHCKEIASVAKYEYLPANTRLQLFRWLLKEFLKTALAREHHTVNNPNEKEEDVDEEGNAKPKTGKPRGRRKKADVLAEAEAKAAAEAEAAEEAAKSVEKAVKMQVDGLEPHNTAEPDRTEAVEDEPKKRRKRRAPAKPKKGARAEAGGDDENEEDDNKGQDRRMKQKTSDVDVDGNIRHSRLVPLGSDRHGHRYWAFCFAGPPPAPAPKPEPTPKTSATASSDLATNVEVKAETSAKTAMATMGDEELARQLQAEEDRMYQQDLGAPSAQTDRLMPESSENAATSEVFQPEPVPAEDLGMDAKRIFRENPFTGEWKCYCTKMDLNNLLAWLDPRGKIEKATLGALLNWVQESGLPVMLPPQLGMPTIKQNLDGKKLNTAAAKGPCDLDTESEDEGIGKRIKREDDIEAKSDLKPATDEDDMAVSLSYADLGLKTPVASSASTENPELDQANMRTNNRSVSKMVTDASKKRQELEEKQKEELAKAQIEYEEFCQSPSDFDKTEENMANLAEEHLNYWHHFEQTSVLFCCKVKLTGTLGMAVKETKDIIKARCVMVIGFKSSDVATPAEKAGLCVGDRLLACNKTPITSISKLQSTVMAAKKDAGDDGTAILEVLVARTSTSLAWLPPQYSDDALRLAAADYKIEMTNFNELSVSHPGRTSGLISDVIFRCQNAAYFPAKTVELGVAGFTDLMKVDENGNDILDHRQKMDVLIKILLDAEDALATATRNNRARKTAREMNMIWLGDERLRFQWRRVVSESTGFAQLSVCATIFGLCIAKPLLPYD